MAGQGYSRRLESTLPTPYNDFGMRPRDSRLVRRLVQRRKQGAVEPEMSAQRLPWMVLWNPEVSFLSVQAKDLEDAWHALIEVRD